MTIRLNGSTSGYTEIDAPAIAGAGVLTLPSGTGTLLTAEGGKVLQIVRATDATDRSTTSTSFVDAGISVTITPQKATSAVMLFWSFFAAPVNNGYLIASITNSSNTAISGANDVRTGDQTSTGMNCISVGIGYATPATTSAVTFKGRFRTNVGTSTIGNATNLGQLYAIEVSA